MSSLLMNSLLVAGLVSAASPPRESDLRRKFVFSETFDDDKDVFSSSRWVKSQDAKYEDQPIMVKGLNEASELMKGDLGLELTQENKFYGVGAPFKFDFKGQDLVAQYEFNAEKFECGGAYIKLPRGSSDFNSLNADSPYSIMFGPDRCGTTSKVHFIIQYQNPVTLEWEEKHLVDPPQPSNDGKTHLYTLHLKKDSSYEIFIDKKSVKSGSILTDMEPSINPPELIDDPTDSKPLDWVDEAQIPDPSATKPEDWDEDAPLMIDDLDQKMPSDWKVDAPLMIPDPEASRPDDWDDEEDGIWEAPLVPNPDCADSGCGTWTQPQKKNPDYKGPWSPPLIDNPEYKGEWKARQINNPAFFKHENPVDNIAAIEGLFLEVWTTNNAFHFDNFVFGNSIDEAFAFAEATFDIKSREEELESQRKKEEFLQASRAKKLEEGGIAGMIEVYFAMFVEFVMKQNPIAIAGTLAALFASVVLLIIRGSGSSTQEQVERVVRAEEVSSDNAPSEDTADEDKSSANKETLGAEAEAEEKEKDHSPKKKSSKGSSARRSRRTED